MKLWYDDDPTPKQVAVDLVGIAIKAACALTIIYWLVCITLALVR